MATTVNYRQLNRIAVYTKLRDLGTDKFTLIIRVEVDTRWVRSSKRPVLLTDFVVDGLPDNVGQGHVQVAEGGAALGGGQDDEGHSDVGSDEGRDEKEESGDDESEGGIGWRRSWEGGVQGGGKNDAI
jgi:hypothetical protein